MAQSVRQARRSTGAKKAKRSLSSGQVHVFASFNNTIVTVTDAAGNTVAWGSAGSAGFKGSRKSTPFAARLAAEQAIKAAQQMGLQEADLIVKGPGPGRESAFVPSSRWGLRSARFPTKPRCHTTAAAPRRSAACKVWRGSKHGEISWSGL